MKRLKLIPSVLMLVLCVGMLAVGIYAIKPLTNTISGTINISAGSASLQISAYVNDEEYELPSNGKTMNGITWDLIEANALSFDASSATSADQVLPKVIRLRLENLTNEELGAFFYNGQESTLDANGCATYASLMHEANIYKAGEEETPKNIIATVEFSTYTYLAPKASIDMYAIFEAKAIDSQSLTGLFDFKLKVENYSPNQTTSDASENTNELIKFSSSLDSISVTNNETVKGIVIPNSVTSLSANTFSGLTNLEHIIIPKGTTMTEGTFGNNCGALKSISLPCFALASHEDDESTRGATMFYYFKGTADNTYTFNELGNTYYLPKGLTCYVTKELTDAEMYPKDISPKGSIDKLIFAPNAKVQESGTGGEYIYVDEVGVETDFIFIPAYFFNCSYDWDDMTDNHINLVANLNASRIIYGYGAQEIQVLAQSLSIPATVPSDEALQCIMNSSVTVVELHGRPDGILMDGTTLLYLPVGKEIPDGTTTIGIYAFALGTTEIVIPASVVEMQTDFPEENGYEPINAFTRIYGTLEKVTIMQGAETAFYAMIYFGVVFFTVDTWYLNGTEIEAYYDDVAGETLPSFFVRSSTQTNIYTKG